MSKEEFMKPESQDPYQKNHQPAAGAVSGCEGADKRSGSDQTTSPKGCLSLRGGRAGDFMHQPRKAIHYALLVMAAILLPGCNLPNTPNPVPIQTTVSHPNPCQVDWGGGSGDNNPELVARVENMLAEHGATITDATGDWIWPGNQEDNPNPYPVAWADLTSATFAVDADYLYIRLNVNGVYPRSETDLPRYGQDQIQKLNINIGLDTDNNPKTGSLADGGSEVMLGSGMMMTPNCGWMDAYDFWYGPTGIDQPETERYAHTFNRNLVVAAWGGAGFDYRTIVYPVGSLGIRPGQTIGVIGWDECASLQYPDRHATFDVLGTGGINNRAVIQLP